MLEMGIWSILGVCEGMWTTNSESASVVFVTCTSERSLTQKYPY